MTTEHLDVLVVGAGISGIGAAYHLQRDHPQRTVALLEARGAIGGTWDLFRYPGVRSDSDLHTFGYEFRPWRDEQSIADADRILAYLRETAAESGIDRLVRFHSQVLGASWSSSEGRWTVDVLRTDTGERATLTCTWLFCAAGYYRYDEGFTPDFTGRERFRGQVVHPQHWPDDLDVTGRRVVVIGSGATAVTLVPALAGTAAHVTMLQRTPTYVLPVGRRDPVADRLRRWLGEERAFPLIRRKNIAQQRAVWAFCQRYPRAARRLIRWVNARQLPAGYDVDVHFNPPYDPWTQRLCVVPDGDLFRAISDGTADVVTDRIATFTEHGVLLESGRWLGADLIVTATGLNVQPFGGAALDVDGQPVHLPDTLAYKGMMLSGVPNFAYAIGYTNSSWTLKVGLLCEHFSRLLAHMDARGYDVCRPEVGDPDMPTRPFLDFGAGYIRRAVDQLPRQGDRMPWRTSMNYQEDAKLLRTGRVTDPELVFSRVPTAEAVTA
jgi:monooxygenase